MLLHSRLSLIWYATWPCSEKVEFRPIDHIPRWVGVSVRKIFAIMLLQAWFSLICNMTCSEKVEFWSFDPIPKPKITFDMFHICSTVSLYPCLLTPSLGWGGGGNHVAAFVILFSLICNITWPCSEKVEFWPIQYWPQTLSPPRGLRHRP